ncbi:Polymorphic membrane protein F,chlamydial polymorphic outer membrane protein repeat,Autotransporter beta-domain [Chlamydia serpentis]|uniref:Polymorphic membrane protein F,chlamydial polymorphic outer membrane protein repeat,Autotransporter beta-domain n=1 Tax=Chlamydia serpentis TaxID=1967782 RepID=A0A2R8FBG1_9CHLA|nr:polymorphic outer membrane protein middle domain-containing protein [Chlamydia serpentis]SPN73587.1 Polymorphic membrane protein F,chlamydial polymorphic outer membrane protein repeat,Autotransporter beta-domain [Chlamydia serpentis]
MPLSFKSSSFFLFACLCSGSYAFAEIKLGGNIVPPITTQGEEIIFSSDAIFKNILGAQFSTGFINSSEDLPLLGNGHSLTFFSCQAPRKQFYTLLFTKKTLTLENFSLISFTDNSSTGSGGLIYGKNIILKSIKELRCSGNRVTYSPPAITTTTPSSSTTIITGPAIFQPTNSLIMENISGAITFFSNLSNFGSAISSTPTTTITIRNNSASMDFSHNFTSSAGGVIYGGQSVLFENNSGTITFTANSCANSLQGLTPTENFALGSGGAICIPTGTLNFKNNKGPYTFSYNATPNDAGAIYVENCNFIGNQGAFVFDSNTAAKNGGAICAKVLNIESRGSIDFKYNRAEKGGAIFIGPSIGDPIKTTSTLTIQASKGDITFERNMLNTKPGIRNAITVEGGGEIVSLSATEGSRLLFYDPITHNLPTTSPTNKNIMINANGSSGSVVFSSQGLSSTELLLPGNTTTTLLGTVRVAGGELAITENAAVNVLGFATQGSGQLTLGSGGALGLADITGGTPAAVDFTIGKLAFDPISFLKKDFAAASVNAKTKTVTLTGALSLANHDEDDLYDTPLLKSPVAIPIAIFKGATVTKTGFPDGDIVTTSHYGYQGKWSYTWTRPLLISAPDGGFPGGLTPAANTLFVVWSSDTPVHSTYILNPERYGEIVSNSLWISFLGNQSFSDLLEDVFEANHQGLCITAKALGAYVEHTPRIGHEGFSGRYGGYQASLSMNYVDETTIGLSFGQLYGKTNANPYDAHCSEQMYRLSFFGRFPFVTKHMETRISWETAYGYSNNHLKTTYIKPNKTRHSQGQWHNNSYYVLVSAEHPFLNSCLLTSPLAKAWDLSGFISAEFLGGWQSKFTETGDLARSFSRGKGYNVSLPIGCSSQLFTSFKKAPSTLTMKIAYKPDIYRVNPHNIVTIVSNQESASISGAHLRRHGLFLQMHDLVDLSEKTQAFLNYTFDGKNGFTSHRVSTGVQSIF